MQRRLVEVASARAGDKGALLDLSLFAADRNAYQRLAAEVTGERVRQHLAPLGASQVERYELPRLRALKFVVHGALEGGAARSLRADNLGKTLGAALLRMEVDWPDAGQEAR